MDNFELIEQYLNTIKIDADHQLYMDGILEAFDAIKNWSFARDVNSPVKYSGLYYGFTEQDTDIPKPARKKSGVVVTPDFASGAGFTSGFGPNQSMNSYGM